MSDDVMQVKDFSAVLPEPVKEQVGRWVAETFGTTVYQVLYASADWLGSYLAALAVEGERSDTLCVIQVFPVVEGGKRLWRIGQPAPLRTLWIDSEGAARIGS